MTNIQIIPIILSGGSGTRMWPLSRSDNPKQFLPLFGRDSFFKETLSRVKMFDKKNFRDPLIVGNIEHGSLIAKQAKLQKSVISSTILEPCSKNTAPAITVACLEASNLFSKDDYILALPADHLIQDEVAFINTINKGLQIADKESIILFGIKPDKPHTGFGYIELGKEHSDFYEVIRFTEKPEQKLAQSFVDKKNFLWNGGIFLINIEFYLSLMEQADPYTLKNCIASLEESLVVNDQIVLAQDRFESVTSSSIDTLIMEKAIKKNIPTKVIPMDIGWSDMGTWNSFWEHEDKDQAGNVSFGNIFQKDTKNSLFYSEDKALVSLGMEGVVMISTPDAVLISSKDKSEELKELVDSIEKKDSPLVNSSRKVIRPWGSYETVDETNSFKIKKIVVSPGQKLSKQSHEKRSETWVVVKGRAKITIGDKDSFLEVNQSIFIPVGTTHRLENQESYALELVEVQTGTYFGEDDIKRYEDDYGRK